MFRIDHYSLSRLLLIMPFVMIIGAAIGVGMAWASEDIHLAPKFASLAGGLLGLGAFYYNQSQHGSIIIFDEDEEEVV